MIFKITFYSFVWRSFFPLQKVQTLMKCNIMLHFIWVFTVCRSIRLEVFQIQRVKIRWHILKTYAAISHAHLSRVWKQEKLSGSCLLTFYGFWSTQLSDIFMPFRCPTFSWQNKVIKRVRNIYWPFISTDRLSTKDRYMLLRWNQTTYTITVVVTNTKVAESLLFERLFRAANDLALWPSG